MKGFPYTLYVNKVEDIPSNYVKFGDTSDAVEYWHAIPDQPVYFLRKGRQIIVEQCNQLQARFFRWYKFYSHFHNLFDPKNEVVSDKCRLHLNGINLYEGETPIWAFNMAIYVDKDIIQDIYNRQTVPKILLGIIYHNSYSQVVNLNIKATKLIESNNIELYQGCSKRKPFIWQQNNIKWMCNLENAPLQFKVPEIPSELNVYKINSLKEYVIFTRSKNTRPYNPSTIKIKNIQSLKHYTIDLKGGILADQVGLGKTYSMIGLMELVPKLTLIIAPGRLCKQIKHEIITYSNLKPWIVAGYGQYKHFDSRISKYNTIICSVSVLTNLNV